MHYAKMPYGWLFKLPKCFSQISTFSPKRNEQLHALVLTRSARKIHTWKKACRRMLQTDSLPRGRSDIYLPLSRFNEVKEWIAQGMGEWLAQGMGEWIAQGMGEWKAQGMGERIATRDTPTFANLTLKKRELKIVCQQPAKEDTHEGSIWSNTTCKQMFWKRYDIFSLVWDKVSVLCLHIQSRSGRKWNVTCQWRSWGRVWQFMQIWFCQFTLSVVFRRYCLFISFII